MLQGKTYTKVNVPKDNSTWMIENAIAQYRGNASAPDMHVQTFRTSTGTALQSWSSNGGLNWTYPVNSTLPNPNSRVNCPFLSSLITDHSSLDNILCYKSMVLICRGSLTWK